MNKRVAQLALVFCIAGAVSVGCGSEDDSANPPQGGAGGLEIGIRGGLIYPRDRRQVHADGVRVGIAHTAVAFGR